MVSRALLASLEKLWQDWDDTYPLPRHLAEYRQQKREQLRELLQDKSLGIANKHVRRSWQKVLQSACFFYPPSSQNVDHKLPLSHDESYSSDSFRVVFYHGRLVHCHLPAGITVTPFTAQDMSGTLTDFHHNMSGYSDQGLFQLISESTLHHGYYLEVNGSFNQPIELRHLYDSLTTNSKYYSYHPYLFVQVHDRSRVCLQESHRELSRDHINMMWVNSHLKLALGASAQCEHTLMSHLSAGGHLSSSQSTYLQQNASYKLLELSSGIPCAERNHHLLLAGRGSSAELSGAYYSGDHYSQKNLVVHQGVATSSQQIYKGMAYGDGFSLFDGKMHILAGAVGSDAHLLSRGLIFDKTARMISIPELVCGCDEVSASHGATVSEPDEEDLWYLCARGLSYAQAYDMLIQGFLMDVLLKWPSIHQDVCYLEFHRGLKAVHGESGTLLQ
ncbi:MAG: SufD family Fe-S cluster assembly protein [Proteobacteria bacterium]|nr:SufD family Fe-S cluster assembly protein [Pseudomonadota bacterium]